MKKGIIVAIIFVLLVVIGGVIWFVMGQKEIATSNKRLFIPSNSAYVVHYNQQLSEVADQCSFIDSIATQETHVSLRAICDTLARLDLIDPYSQISAYRLEGRSNLVQLSILNLRSILTKGEILDAAAKVVGSDKIEKRKFSNYTIETIEDKDKKYYVAICEGIALLSNSQLFIEDGIKQYEDKEYGTISPNSPSVTKLFSESSPINLFFNKRLFTQLYPQVLESKLLLPIENHTDLIEWGALDCDVNANGVSLNGFLGYDQQGNSYFSAFKDQRSSIPEVLNDIPKSALSLSVMNISDIPLYSKHLQEYRYKIGTKRKIDNESKLFRTIWGNDFVKEFMEQLQGEFARVDMSYSEVDGKPSSIVIAPIKSRSLMKQSFDNASRHYAVYKKTSLDGLKGTIQQGEKYPYFKLQSQTGLYLMLGDFFHDFSFKYTLIDEDNLVFSTDLDNLKEYLLYKQQKASIEDAAWYINIEDKIAREYNIASYTLGQPAFKRLGHVAKGDFAKLIKNSTNSLDMISSFAGQWSNEGDKLYNSLYISTAKVEKEKPVKQLISTSMKTKNTMKAVEVKNHITGKKERFVQDDSLYIYLIGEGNRVLWKRKLKEKINSKIWQIDAYKNGKLQLLFSTPNQVYLIDRLGRDVAEFPIKLASTAPMGISLYDYDKSRDYRIFVPLQSKKVVLYDQKGEQIDGWNVPSSDQEIVTKIKHYRLGGKDYIVFADRVRIYILNRRGEERVRVNRPLELTGNVDISLSRDSKGHFVVLKTDNKEYHVTFTGVVKEV